MNLDLIKTILIKDKNNNKNIPVQKYHLKAAAVFWNSLVEELSSSSRTDWRCVPMSRGNVPEPREDRYHSASFDRRPGISMFYNHWEEHYDYSLIQTHLKHGVFLLSILEVNVKVIIFWSRFKDAYPLDYLTVLQSTS